MEASWELLSAGGEEEDPSKPFPRNGQCGVLSSKTGGLVVGFGFMLDFLAPNYFSDVFNFDVESREWSKLSEAGEGPCPRVEASMVEHKGDIFLLGGYNQLLGNLSYQQDLWRFDPVSRQWTKLAEELVPGFLPRVGVKLASDGENLYGFFGYAAVGDGNIYFDDVIRFDFESNTWTQISVAGESPPPRTGHAVTVVGRKVYLFGGYNETIPGKYMDDMWRFDLDSLTWEPVSGAGASPCGRNSFGMVSSPDGSAVYLCGGIGHKVYLNDVWRLDLGSLTWTKAEVRVPKPPPIKEKEEDAEEGEREASCGSSGALEEARRKLNSEFVMTPRAFHTVVLHRDSLVVFGGYGSSEEGQEGRYFGDVWRFSLADADVQWTFEEAPSAE